MDYIHKLAEKFARFPGIGERQSKRFVYFLLSQHPEYLRELVDGIGELRKHIRQCSSCYIFFESSVGATICATCSDPRADEKMLMIVEKDIDVDSVKKSKSYIGKYFVLGGLVPIVTKTTRQTVRSNELVQTIRDRAERNGLTEVILAFSLSPNGNHTDMYVRELLYPLSEEFQFKVSSLGRGLSTGTELEYSDSETLKYAMRNRQ